MTESKRIKIAAIGFVISGLFEVLQLLIDVGDRVHNILWGLQLLLLLVSIGISAKIAGSISVDQKLRARARVTMVLSGLLGVYLFIL